MQTIIISIGIIIIVLISFILLRKRSKVDIDEKTLGNKNVSNFQLPQKKAQEVNTSKKGGIFDQKPNPMIKEKAANWTTATSYEEDIDKLISNEKEVGNSENKDLSIPVSSEPTKIVFKDNDTSDNIKPVLKTQILLVDDSLVVRKYVGDLLKKHNYDVVLKNDGWEAITYLRSTTQKPDLIISDIEMPNMNGFQLIEAIREEKRYNNVPILVISAHAENHLKLMEEEKIQGFIKKPFNDEDLLLQIDYLINAH